MISKEEVQHIAKLARIDLSAKETDQFQKELAEVLQYFGILAEVDVSRTEPMTHAVPLQNRKRKDQAKPKTGKEGRFLLEMAPEKHQKYVKVRSVLS